MSETTTIRVEWNTRIGGGFTAIAAEEKGGYKKGEIISQIPFQMKKFPKELCIITKHPHESI